MGKKSSVQWKFRLCFDFDTFLCFQREKPPPHYGEGVFQALVLQVGNLNAAPLWVQVTLKNWNRT